MPAHRWLLERRKVLGLLVPHWERECRRAKDLRREQEVQRMEWATKARSSVFRKEMQRAPW